MSDNYHHSDGDDEENGRVTPKRINTDGIPVIESTVLKNPSNSTMIEAQEVLSKSGQNTSKSDGQSNSDIGIDELLASLSSLPNVLIKDEPPDKENLHSEEIDGGISSPLCTIKSEKNCSPSREDTENSTFQTHPQINLVSTYRLRVKQEFTDITTCNDVINETANDSFDGQNLLPDNFFDDLLIDRVQERVEEAENVELEEKYSDRLKLLQQLEGKKHSKEKKKHKKSKKKSRKRSRSRSRDRGEYYPSISFPKTNRVYEEYTELPSTSKRSRPSKSIEHHKVNDIEDDSKKWHSLMDVGEQTQVSNEINDTLDPHLPEIGPHLTAKQKRDRILIRAKLLISYLKRIENVEDLPFTKFLYTSTVRKLPASYSYRHQHIYENRSPLHTINNVKYKFNSHSSEFNFEEWGLASLPPLSAKMAKLLGYDAATMHNKIKEIKIPAKLRNIKSEDQDNEDEELLQHSQLSLYCNATTQTDEMVPISVRKKKGYDIGVQCKPSSLEMATQTLETEAPSIRQFDNEDELPIMTLMRQLNDNQLMALHDFAELLMEPATNAMDMYRLRQRMLEIYKSSQVPSALPALISVSGNSYTSNESVSSTHRHQIQQQEHQNYDSAFRIETVSSADGRRITINDPREKRDMRNIPRLNGNFSSRSPSSSHSNFQNQQQKNQAYANSGNKYYGRGGFRR